MVVRSTDVVFTSFVCRTFSGALRRRLRTFRNLIQTIARQMWRTQGLVGKSGPPPLLGW